MKTACAAFLNHKRPDLAKAMVQQLTGGPFPIYAFDNGGGLSRDGLGDARIVSRPDNVFFTGGWNWAMSILGDRYEFIWMLNDDVEGVSQRMLAQLLAEIPDNAAAITPAFNSPHAVFHRRESSLRNVRWVDWCCPLVRVKAWHEVGPFDTRVAGYGGDLDWCKRARDWDWRFCVHDGLEVHHLGSATASSEAMKAGMRDVVGMNRFLREKWGVTNWTEMT